MITQLDNQSWAPELETGNAQFIEIGSTIYVVSQVRADNTFAVFKSNPTPPTPGPGYSFQITATYAFPTVSGKNNTSFDPVVTYDPTSQRLYIIGTQDDDDGKCVNVLLFSYSLTSDTLGTPTTLTTASYVRDSYDICVLGQMASPPTPSNVFVTVAVTNPTIIWQTPTVSDVTSISISGNVLTVSAYNSFSIGQQITFSGLQNATFLNGVTVTVDFIALDGSYFTAAYVYDDYVQEGYENGYATWLPGHSLLGFELTETLSPPTVSLVGITVLDSSPFRSGNTFGAVSVYSPDGLNIEVYYESHPKVLTFTDQNFNLNLASRVYTDSPPTYTWTLPSTVLKTFSGRYADNRLTVIPNGITRTLLHQYYSQLVHQNALVGNLLLGYYDGLTQWAFHSNMGSTTISYMQGTLSISNTQGAFISYLAEPVYSIKGEWSPSVKKYAINDRVIYNEIDYIVNEAIAYPYIGVWTSESTYAAGSIVKVTLTTLPISYVFYTAKNEVSISTISPNLDTTNWSATPTPNIDSRFTVAPTAWPLKTSAYTPTTFNMSDVPGFYNTLNFSWIRGAKGLLDDLSKWALVGEQAGSTTSGATYVSDFNVPPVVKLIPSGSTTIKRGSAITFDASGTNDGDTDPLQFTWTYSPINSNVSLTSTGDTASFLVNRSIGGAATSFTVGVVAVDYSGTTPLHPPMNIINVTISSGILTITTDSLVSLSIGEQVFIYELVSATFLNDTKVVVTSISNDSFSAEFTYADYSSPDTGKAIANAQFSLCEVLVPFNTPPTIDFSHDGTTHASVSLPIQAARNSMVTINPTYTGLSDPDDRVTYLWTQVLGTVIPSTQITSGITSSYLQFQTQGAPVQGDTIVWSLTVSDGVNPSDTSTVEVDVASHVFSITDTLRLSRSMWGSNNSSLIQSNSYSVYPSTSPSSLSFPTETQQGSLIVAFESQGGFDTGTKTFGGQSFITAAADDEWDINYIINANPAITVTGFASNPANNADFAIAEFSSKFTVFDQSAFAGNGTTATLTTTNASGNSALIILSIKLYNSLAGTLTGAPPVGWTPLVYNATQGALAAVFYQVVTTPNTTISFVWPSLSGNDAMETSLISFNSTTPISSGGGGLSMRNTEQTWSPLEESAIYTNFQSIKRSSVLGGADRYLLISSASVCVYGGNNPNFILLRRLFTPNSSAIVDAVHTENDATFVLDITNKLYRYSTAPLINTDNPDVTIDLTEITSMSFNKVFTTYSFANVRTVILTGPDGCLLLQLNNTSLAIQGDRELTVEDGMLYGIDNVQFVRASNVESLNTGKLLIGTVASITASITSVTISGNTGIIVAPNTFTQGQNVTFMNLTGATFLNGITAPIVSATSSQFIIGFEHIDYPTTLEGNLAMATTGGKTYETLIDLSHGQIIGVWDASKLLNPIVTTGEILFESNDTYSGAPIAPVLNPIINAGATTGNTEYVNLTISWTADRPDLIRGYDLDVSFDSINWITTAINSGYIETITVPEPLGQTCYFRVKALSVDGTSPYSNIESIHT
jgi:hypothetical protein